MAIRTIESVAEVEEYLKQINEILSIPNQQLRHFGYYRRDDDKDVYKTLSRLNINVTNLKQILKDLKVKDYSHTIIDKVNTYERLPVFLIKLKGFTIYIKLGIKYEQLFVYCFSFHEQEIDEYDKRPYKDHKETILT